MSGLLLSAHSPKPGTCVIDTTGGFPGTTPTGLDKGKSFMRGLGQLFESQGLATGEMVRVAAQREERFRIQQANYFDIRKRECMIAESRVIAEKARFDMEAERHRMDMARQKQMHEMTTMLMTINRQIAQRNTVVGGSTQEDTEHEQHHEDTGFGATQTVEGFGANGAPSGFGATQTIEEVDTLYSDQGPIV